MPDFPILDLFSPYDYLALGLLFGAWILLSWRIDKAEQRVPSVSYLMRRHQAAWMEQMLHRGNRIFDSTIIGSLRQATAFLASASLLAIGGLMAVMGDVGRLSSIARDLTQSATPQALWEAKLLVILVIVSSSFLKFLWSNRLFGYCSVLMGAVPNDPAAPGAELATFRAAKFAVLASRSFNRGLRSIYFGLAATAWLLGEVALIGATVLCVIVISRREFASGSRRVLLDEQDNS
ncbi:DUF599 domain-containing protein [Alphaproteobacteria bacterium KMM 3653]|uniref:DUF599 domain-containing protein n=1 Tax=Harenicola maris TaxID=2841044 RepID=A0AAP2CXK9_9RHOB|nr:DUF599 domain-containing protein [Harenicola maris]